MRIWAKTTKNQKVIAEVVQEFALARPSAMEDWYPVLHTLCQALDLSRPVLVQKHISDLARFSRVEFRPSDFMEEVAFDRFIIEIFPDKKKENTASVRYT